MPDLGAGRAVVSYAQGRGRGPRVLGARAGQGGWSMDAARQKEHASSGTVPLVSPVAQLAYVFSEYSSRTGNAMSTKINAQARAHEALGGRSYVLVSDRRQHDYPDGTLVPYASSRSTRREWFTDLERRLDAVCGVAVGRRPLV